MDEISLGKARIILLPILLGLIIIFFLKIFSIKVSPLVWIVLLVAIFFIFLLLVIKSRITSQASFATSKLPLSIRTILVVLVIAVIASAVIISVFYQAPRSIDHIEVRTSEHFDNNKFNKDYGYTRINGGKFAIVNGSLDKGELSVFRAVKITSTAVDWYLPKLGFSIKGIEGKKGERVKVDVLLESRTGVCPFSFTIGPSVGVVKVEIGIGKDDRVWVKVNNSPIDIGDKQFDSSEIYDIAVSISSNKAEETAETRGSLNSFITSFALTEVSLG